MHNPEVSPLTTPTSKEGPRGKRYNKDSHIRRVAKEVKPEELTEADMVPTVTEEAEAHMAKVRAMKTKEDMEMGAARALGREQNAIREVQAQLAAEAVNELVAEHDAEESDKEAGFGAERTIKPPAKKATLLDRVKGWFR